MSLRSKIAAALLCGTVAVCAWQSFPRANILRDSASQVYNGVLDLEPDPLLEPRKLFDVHGIRLCRQIYSTLLTYDDQHAIIGDLANSWRISPEGREYVFTLRANLFFNDGTPVKTADIVATLRSLGRPDSVINDAWKYVQSVEAHGDSAIVIRLKQKFTPFLDFLASPTTGIGKERPPGTPYRPIGTGPYRVREWIAGKSISLERNPYYYGPAPKIGRVNFYLARNPDEIRRLLGMMRLHDLGWYNPDIGDYRDDYVELESPSLQVNGIFFNLSRPPFSDPTFRGEFVRAIDKRGLVSQLASGGVIAKGYLPLGMLGHNASLPVSMYEPGGDFGRLGAYKKPLIVYCTTKDNTEALRLGEFLRKAFQRFSLDVRVHNLSEREAYDIFVRGEYTAIRMSNEAAFPDAYGMLSSFIKGSPDSFSRYSDAEFERMLNSALMTDNRDARAKIYEQMDEFLVRHHYLLPLYYNSKKKKFHKSVRGIHMSLLGEHLIDISRLSLE